MTTKRSIKRKLEALEQESAPEKERLEIHLDKMLMYEPEPELTDAFQPRGFAVGREERDHGHGNEDVVLHTTPSASDIFHDQLVPRRPDCCCRRRADRLGGQAP